MRVWTSLTQENNARLMAGEKGEGATLFQQLAGMAGCKNTGSGESSPEEIDLDIPLMIPLQFWFCRNPGLALPLIALQYHEVKVVTSFTNVFPSAATAAATAAGAKLWADYIYLDTDERRRSAQVSHEYLIEQVQFQAGAASSVSTELNFNHPVKELVWTTGYDAGDLSALTGAYHLKLNGHDRMASRATQYYTRQQVWITTPAQVVSPPRQLILPVPLEKEPTQLLYTLLPSSLKNISHPEHATSLASIMLSYTLRQKNHAMFSLSTTMSSVSCRVWEV